MGDEREEIARLIRENVSGPAFRDAAMAKAHEQDIYRAADAILARAQGPAPGEADHIPDVGKKIIPAPGEAVDMLAWLSEHRRLELDYGYDDEFETLFWRVNERSGNINDREWNLIGQGATPLAALLSAKSFLEAATPREA